MPVETLYEDPFLLRRRDSIVEYKHSTYKIAHNHSRLSCMPLTRHIYTQDEVVAALMFCALRGKSVEATFWTLELLDSELVEEVMRALKQVWL